MADKTIADKMYLKTAKSLVVFNGAANPGVVALLPQELVNMEVGQADADVVLLFALNQRELDQWWPAALARLGEKGSLWIGYLKHSAPKATDLDRDVIARYARERGITDVALVSLNADWSAVRLKRI